MRRSFLLSEIISEVLQKCLQHGISATFIIIGCHFYVEMWRRPLTMIKGIASLPVQIRGVHFHSAEWQPERIILANDVRTRTGWLSNEGDGCVEFQLSTKVLGR